MEEYIRIHFIQLETSDVSSQFKLLDYVTEGSLDGVVFQQCTIDA